MSRVFGVETEWLFAILGESNGDSGNESAIDAFLSYARKLFPSLDGYQSSGIFLATGGRLYRDRFRLEMTTPETTDPRDTCRYLLANDRLLGVLAEEYRRATPSVGRVFLSRSNVTYGRFPTTSGCHESYSCRSQLSTLSEQMIPFLVSRVVVTGCGGFNNRVPGLQFSLSPRVPHLEAVISSGSTENRGIFHTKSESLGCDGLVRLHVLCGESNCSETSNVLKIGTAALVVAMIDAGLVPGHALRLRNPLVAMQRFARDVNCRVRVRMTNGEKFTAIQIQRRYLEMAEAHLQADWMPPWAPMVCGLWRRILDRLEQGWEAVDGTLDWAIKRRLYTRRLAQQDLTWTDVDRFNYRLGRQNPYPAGPVSGRRERLLELLIALGRPDPGLLGPEAAPDSRAAADLGESTSFMAVSDGLFELDSRYSQCAEGGVFSLLDSSGVLDHHVEGVDNIDEAMEHPPGDTRARIRGECIRRFTGQKGRYRTDWSSVVDWQERKMIDLRDPLAREETWISIPAERRDTEAERFEAVRLLREADREYDEGSYEFAFSTLMSLEADVPTMHTGDQINYWRYSAWVAARRGYLDGNESLDRCAHLRPSEADQIVDYVCVYRFEGLRPVRQQELMRWIRRGVRYLRPDDPTGGAGFDQTTFREHYACYLLQAGKPQAAREMLAPVYERLQRNTGHGRIYGRVLATLANIYRVLGDRRQALTLYRKARKLQTGRGYRGDLAEFTLTGLARLATTRRRAMAWLAAAKDIQQEQLHDPALIRTLLLEARISGDPETAADARSEVETLRADLPAMEACPLLKCVLANWDTWLSGGPSPQGHPDPFWGV